MPLTTKSFWFEELKRVKDLPVGDKEILTKYVGGPGQPDNTYFLVRNLPLNLREEPVGVFYFYNYDPVNGGSVWLCMAFVVGGALMRDAMIELVDRSEREGLVLDDGTVLSPRIRDHFAALPVLERNVPIQIKERTPGDLQRSPEIRKEVVAGVMASTFIAGEMAHPLLGSVDVAVVAFEKRGPDDSTMVTIRWRRAR